MSEFKPANPNRSDNTLLIAGLLGGGFLICVCVGVIVFGIMTGLVSFWGINSTAFVPTPYYGYPYTEAPYGLITPNFTPPAPETVEGVMEALAAAEIPERDRLDLAERFRGVENAQPEPQDEYQVGDTTEFWVTGGNEQAIRVQATLVYMTDVVYMWMEIGSNYDLESVKRSADRFTEETYPDTRDIFGSEANPGVDGDPRLHILQSSALGSGLAGMYYSPSEYPIEAVPYSNEKEIFFISSYVTAGTDTFDSILAHEFQHMIHWNVDRNEETWLNEGMGEVSITLNGYGTSGFVQSYFSFTDTQLTAWATGADSGAHYGGSYLFGMYFYDRFGEDALKALIAHDENGLSSIDATLEELGEDLTADDLFVDWSIANVLNDLSIDPRYGYTTIPALPPPFEADTVYTYPYSQQGMMVAQYGIDYIKLAEDGDVTLTFDGSQQVAILPTNTQESAQTMTSNDGSVWWSNRADNSDTTLTRTVDLSGIQSASLEFDLWFSIEDDYDYGYITVSTDGEHWTAIETDHTTDSDPYGNAYGFGYSGQSSNEYDSNNFGWVHESIDLSAYAGQQIYIRFEYITDDALSMPGMAIDNICIEAINWCDDASQLDQNWEAQGWVRHSNVLPQQWSVQIITYDANGNVQVEQLKLDDNQHGEIDIHIEPDQPALLVISGLTRFTTESAVYNFSLTP